MKVLGLDLSTSTGYAVIEKTEDKDPLLKEWGTLALPRIIQAYGDYPWCYVRAARDIARECGCMWKKHTPDYIVIEETNQPSKFNSRYTQKILEFIHHSVLQYLEDEETSDYTRRVVYVSTSEWRRNLALTMSTADRHVNARLRNAQNLVVAASGNAEAEALAKKKLQATKRELGVLGKVTPKHLSVRFVNDKFNLKLKPKDNDIADAICLVLAFLNGVTPCDGVF